MSTVLQPHVIIGDIHGRTYWRDIVISLNLEHNGNIRVIFLGDYCDSYYHTDQQIYDELEDIIRLKQLYPEQVILLTGNHDVGYAFKDYRCSGHRKTMEEGLHKLFVRHRHLFQLVYQKDNHLFSHAGISEHWMTQFRSAFAVNYGMLLEEFMSNTNETLSDVLNDLFQMRFDPIQLGNNTTLLDLLFQAGHTRGGLRGNYGGPVWADLSETKDNHLKGYHQFVGHTPVTFIATTGKDTQSITYCDVHRDRPDFLTKLL